MPQQHDTHDADHESSEVIGRFADSNNAELAAEAALKNGFTVQLRDSTTVAVQPGAHPQHRGEVEGLLRAYGATNLPGAATAAAPADAASATQTVRAEHGARIELVEEELQPHTRPVQAGEVSIRKHVVTETVTIEVPVEREELIIERRPLERRAADQPGTLSSDPLAQALSDWLRSMQPGEVVRIPIVEEEVTVHKQRVVKSEVVIGKRQVREVQQFSDTVRREVADIEHNGRVHVAQQEEQP